MKRRTARAASAKKPATLPTFTPLPPPDAGAGMPGENAPGADPELRRAMIAEAAYYRAEQRGFEPGRELEDWFAAESDIDSVAPRAGLPTACGT